LLIQIKNWIGSSLHWEIKLLN